MDALEPLEARLSGLIATLEPKARRELARDIAKRLRASQAKRIAAQMNPDGTPFAPRKPRLRDKRQNLRGAMFAKMRLAKYLKVETSTDSAAVTFSSQVQRIAQVHQFGLRDRVERGRSSPTVRYDKRELLGFTSAEHEMVADLILTHLAR